MKKEPVLCWIAVVLLGGLFSSCGEKPLPEPDPSLRRSIVVEPGLGEPNFLSQNWTDGEAEAFYNANQGSRIMPYDWFLHLEQADSETLFRDTSNMLKLGYIPRKPDSNGNPDGLPIGFVRDGKSMGLTCAACHTGQINYRGKTWIIDGAPTMSNAPRMMSELEAALKATKSDPAKFKRFVAAVTGDDKPEKLVDSLFSAQLRDLIEERAAYNTRNFPHADESQFGPGRLDAFGAIMNQVAVVFAQVPDAETVHDAPVSYPFLWDTPQHDRVQWNGSAENTVQDLAKPLVGTAHVGALGRNIGEVLGVFAEVDTSEFVTPLGGYQSSVERKNLIDVEEWVRDLWSPKWPEAEFGAIDQALADKGRALYSKHCASCHVILDRTDPNRKVIAKMGNVGTDETMSRNVVTRKGKSGVLEGRRMLQPPFRTLKAEEPIAELLTHVGQHVLVGSLKITKDFKLPESYVVPAEIKDGEKNLSLLLKTLELEDGKIKQATVDSFAKHDEDGVAQEYQKGVNLPGSLSGKLSPNVMPGPTVMGGGVSALKLKGDGSQNIEVKFQYKARPLNGIWATAPYLHGGSVLNMDELLKPAKDRMTRFKVGTLEYDPVNMGFENDGDFEFDTTAQPANSNAGHEYGDTVFTDEERAQLIEYIKTL